MLRLPNKIDHAAAAAAQVTHPSTGFAENARDIDVHFCGIARWNPSAKFAVAVRLSSQQCFRGLHGKSCGKLRQCNHVQIKKAGRVSAAGYQSSALDRLSR